MDSLFYWCFPSLCIFISLAWGDIYKNIAKITVKEESPMVSCSLLNNFMTLS